MYDSGSLKTFRTAPGNNPVQSSTAYINTLHGFGRYVFWVLAWLDRSAYAASVSASFSCEQVTTTYRNLVCLFKTDGGHAVLSHPSTNYLAAANNSISVFKKVSI